jgi:hypothetical protein
MLTRAEVAAGADRESAEGFSTELACAPDHFGLIIGAISANCYANAGDNMTTIFS